MINIFLFSILIISFITDISKRKIYNAVTFPAILLGFLYHLFLDGWNGLLFSIAGFLVGVSLLLIPFLLGGMGAGDVKLLAAIGAMKGTLFVFNAFLYTAVIGGVMGLFLLIYKKGIRGVFQKLLYATVLIHSNAGSLKSMDKTDLSFPYGVAIVLGGFVAYFWGGIV